MNTWFWYAIGAAILYGLHQVFTKLASSGISDGLGGFVVEATAALTIMGCIQGSGIVAEAVGNSALTLRFVSVEEMSLILHLSGGGIRHH